MQRRLPVGFWLPMGALLSVALWYGCEQKGDLSPVSSARNDLAFIDTIIVDPPVISPQGSAVIEAFVVNEQHEPAPGEDVRFTVTRGSFGDSGPDTTVSTDNYGRASVPYTAPDDTGNVSLHVELVNMQETQSRTFGVRATGQTLNGLVTVSADEDTLFADNGASTTQIRARVRNEQNNPVGGVEVNFSTTLGIITSPAITDAVSGTALATLVSTDLSGRATVIASFNGNSDTTYVDFMQPYPASSIEVTPSDAEITAGSDSSVITARVFDEAGEPLRSNVLVTFSATAGTFTAQAVTTSGGVATTTLRAPVTAGEVTITASTGSVFGTTEITVQPGALASLSVTLEADSLWADNSSETLVHAQARDSYGNAALPGAIIAFTSNGGSVTESAPTDASGVATVTFRAGLNPGSATVTALNNSITGGGTVYLRATEANSLELTLSPRQLVADGQSTAILRALVLDSENRPVSNGVVVTFTSELGQLGGAGALSSKPGDGTIKRTSSTQKVASGRENTVFRGSSTRNDQLRRYDPTSSVMTATTESGYAVVLLTSSTASGSDPITASVGSLVDEDVATYVAGAPATVEVTPGSTELPADGISSTQVVCRVYDAYGNALGGGVAISVTATLGTLNPTSGFTNANGTFNCNLTTARQVGNCAIVANANGASGYGEVLFSSPDVEGLVISPESSSILADGQSSALVTVTVLDEYSLPVQGQPVSWSSEAGIGELQPITTTTNSNGQATARFYSGASVSDAQQTINAQVGEQIESYSMTMRGVTLLVNAPDPDLPADGETTSEIMATLRETSSGIAIVDAVVRFAASSGSISQFAETNGSGIAVAEYLTGTEPAEVQITASYGDTLRAQTQLILTDTEAQTLVVTIGDATLMADGVSQTEVTALVLDEGSNPVPGTVVSFTAITGGSFIPVEVISDELGFSRSIFLSEASEGDLAALFEVAIERTAVQDSIALTGITVSASSAVQQLPANGSATAAINVSVRQTTSSVGIPGVTVTCGATLGSIASSAVTNSSGLATLTYTAGTDIGTAEVIVRYGNQLSDTVAIQLFSSQPTAVDMSAESLSLYADGVSTSNLTCVLADQAGNPVISAPVSWVVSGPGSLVTAISYTDTNGVATNSYRSSARSTDATATIRAISSVASDSVSIVNRGLTLLLSSQYSAMPANGSSSNAITAQLRETTSLVALPNSEIQFGASNGSIPASVLTNSSGLATTSLLASQSAGNSTVVCRYGNLLTDTAIVNMYTPTAQQLVVSPQSNSVRADGISSLSVTGYVYDAMGVPLANAEVTWTASGMSFTPVQTVTNASGVATLNFVSGASVNDVNVTLTAAAGTAQGFAPITMRGVTVSATAIPEIVIADGSSTSDVQVHVYETSTLIAIPEAVVYFGTDRGTVPESAITNESGVASVTLQASTETGVAHVTASYGNTLSSQASVQFAASTPTHLSLTATPTILFADNISQAVLTANVTDQNGNPVPNGTQVRFSIPPQSGTMENLRTTSGGAATNTLTSSTTPDTFYVSAWAEENSAVRDSVRMIYRVGDPSIVTLSAHVDSLRADGIATDTITAHVTDAVGHALANVEVQFNSTIGNITASRVTDSQGNAKVPFSSSQTGTAIITASAGTATGSYTIHLLPGNPNSIQLSFYPNSVGVRGSGRNETLLITAFVLDANGNPVIDGTAVYFNINNSPGGGDFLSSTGAIPTINGQATVSYNSGTVSGTARIRATCASISAVSTEILIHAGPPFIENVASGCLTSHMAIGASPCSMFGMDVVGESVELICLVGDRYNNPVTPGTAVYFTTSGGVVTTETGYTDSAGFARATLYSGNPLPTVSRWLNTLTDPNQGTSILCTGVPARDGVAKVLVKTAGVDETGDSVWVWATTNVTFDYSEPILNIREVTVGGDPNERDLYIGENALIRISLYDLNFWPMVSGTTVSFSASAGNVYPNEIVVGCPGDTTYTVSFFNSLTLNDDDAATPVLINVEAEYGAAYAFTETFTLHAALP